MRIAGTVAVAALAVATVGVRNCAAQTAAQPQGVVVPTRAAADSLPGTAEDSHQITFVSHRAYWSDILGADVGMGDGITGQRLPGVLIVSGEIRNVSDHAVHHMQVEVELRAGDTVAVRESGYNLGAEVLDAPANAAADSAPAVVPIPPGGSDRFRLLFLPEDLPPFDRYRIRVLDAAP